MVNSIWFYGPSMTTFAHKVFISTTFVTQSFDLKMTNFLKVYFWMLLLRRGPKPPEGPNGPWGPKGPPSPPRELEGGARSTPNF